MYNERDQTSYFIMYFLFFITKQREKKAFFFKGKVRKIGQYIFLLHNINSYKKFRCKMETVSWLFIPDSRLWHCVNIILLPYTLSYFHSQATLSSCSCTGANAYAPTLSALFATGRVTLKADACLCLLSP